MTNKLKPHYRFDQLQAWIVLHEFLQMNAHLPRIEDTPQIVKEAIETLDTSINTQMEGEQDFDFEGNPIGDPEIVMTLADCQDEQWDTEVENAIKELNRQLPLWKTRKIRIIGLCQSEHDPLDEHYEFIAEDGMGMKREDYEKSTGKKMSGKLKVEDGMTRNHVRDKIAELFCPEGYNFNSKAHSFQFTETDDLLYEFKYSRNGANNYQQAAGW